MQFHANVEKNRVPTACVNWQQSREDGFILISSGKGGHFYKPEVINQKQSIMWLLGCYFIENLWRAEEVAVNNNVH